MQKFQGLSRPKKLAEFRKFLSLLGVNVNFSTSFWKLWTFQFDKLPTSLNTATQLYAHNSLVSILSFGLLQRKIHETIDNVARNCWKMCIIFRSYLGTHWCKFDHKMITPISQLKNSQQFAKSHGAVLCCTPWASGPVVWHPTCCRHLWRTKCQATRPSWRFGSWIFMTSWVEFDSVEFPRQHFV